MRTRASMVTPMMNWTNKYNTAHPDFLALFESEQDYVNAVFTQIIMFNYGVVFIPRPKRTIRFVQD